MFSCALRTQQFIREESAYFACSCLTLGRRCVIMCVLGCFMLFDFFGEPVRFFDWLIVWSWFPIFDAVGVGAVFPAIDYVSIFHT